MRVLIRQCRSTFSRLNALRQYSQDTPAEPNQYKNILIEKSNHITTLSINRSATRNSLDVATLTELARALREFDSDDDARALVLAGEGGTFCSGLDLADVRERGYRAVRDAARPLLRRPITDKPSICAVTGFAVAEGLELALACDMRVVEDTAVLGFLGRRFGAIHSIDGAARLASLVGQSRALDLVITGRLISGTVADAWGLAARLVATGTGVGQAINLAMSMVKFPPTGVLLDKLSVVNAQLDPASDDRARNEAVMLTLEAAVADDVSAGVEKFMSGIGRHGKTYGLTQKVMKHWEHEDDDNLR